VTGRINVPLKRPSEAFDHEVSIRRSFSEKPRGARPRSNVSMTFIRPPHHGHRREGEVGSALSSSFARAWFFLSGWGREQFARASDVVGADAAGEQAVMANAMKVARRGSSSPIATFRIIR
jgi:hypothetical protein